MKHYIYKTTNLINGKIYIGKRSHENPEKDKYLGSGNVLKQAISKYGKQNFKKEILAIFLTEEQAYQKQSQLVTMQFIQRNDTYNICPGGRGGRKGMVVVKTQSDKIIVIPNNNENYLNGTWVSIHKGKVVVRNNEGKCFSVDINDPRYTSGQLKGCNQGKFVGIDNEGKYIQIQNLKESVASFERDYLLHYLSLNNWKISQTAKSIGLERTTLYKKIKTLGINHFNMED